MESKKSMFDELVFAERLLASKAKVTEKASMGVLNKLWAPFTFAKGSKSKSKVPSETELEQQMRKCASAQSPWVLRQTPPIRELFGIGAVLGHPGQYGVVRSAVRLSDNKRFAVKILSKERFSKETLKVRASFFRDIRVEVYLLWATSDHPNIVECAAVFEDARDVFVVMSCCDGGELFDRIQGDEAFSEAQASTLFRQMLSAVYYAHQLGVAHCDLKPENFLFRDESAASPLCLIDFGMAKIVEWRKYYNRMHGTPYYIAPEVLDGHYNESCDLWSLGVILFIMIFGFPPFFDERQQSRDCRESSDKAIYAKIRLGFTARVLPDFGAWFPADHSHSVSASCRDLMSRLLRKNVADRMTAEEALEHPWVRRGADNSNAALLMNPTIIHSLRSGLNRSSKNDKSDAKPCALQSQILSILRECHYLNKAQTQSVKAFFDAADKDGDGRISEEELFEALRSVDSTVTRAEAKAMLAQLSSSSDGFMDCDALIAARIKRKLHSKEERLRKVFRAFDLDNSGKISASELKAAAESVIDENDAKAFVDVRQCAELIKGGDLNGDGEIDFEEFIALFTSPANMNSKQTECASE